MLKLKKEWEDWEDEDWDDEDEDDEKEWYEEDEQCADLAQVL